MRRASANGTANEARGRGRLLWPLAGVLLCCSAGFESALAQRGAPAIDIWPLRGPVYLLTGAGANVIASIGPDGVLLVDTGAQASAERVLESIGALQAQLARRGNAAQEGGQWRLPQEGYPPPKPLRYIVNTSARAEHAGGNLALAGRDEAGETDSGAVSVPIVLAHDNVLTRLVNGGAPIDGLPAETYAATELRLASYFNDEGIRVTHVPAASTDGDSIVYFRDSDVIVTGDVFSLESFPVIDVEAGGSIDGVIDALNRVLQIATPGSMQEGGTIVVPGHGRLADAADVAQYRDMLAIIRDLVGDAIERGMTVEQVQAEQPAFGYEARFGSGTGAWTTDMFVEAVYASLARAR